MWTYIISTGQLLHDGQERARGYSGKGTHKNNLLSCNLHNLGPIPIGSYIIGLPFDSMTHGPFCLSLTPDPTNTMFDRNGFLIHGDSKTCPGEASEGCIVLAAIARHEIAGSGDSLLRVASR